MLPPKLEYLQQLSKQRKMDELQTAIGQCSCKELRSFVGIMGVPVRSKEYAIYNNKAGYSALLLQILTSKADIRVTGTKTRKTKNCNLRLVNVLFGDILASKVDELNAEGTQTALDSDQFSENDPFWEKVRDEFVGANVVYGRVMFQENCFTGFELGTPVLHSSEKLWKMWRELCTAYCNVAIRFERSDSPDSQFLGFCRTRVDIYYLRCWLTVKPHLLASVNGKLPREEKKMINSTNVETGFFGEESCGNLGKRKSDVMEQVVAGEDAAEGGDFPRRNEERTKLLNSIKQACETLKTIQELRLGLDVEEVVRCELALNVKRLKSIQEEGLLC